MASHVGIASITGHNNSKLFIDTPTAIEPRMPIIKRPIKTKQNQ